MLIILIIIFLFLFFSIELFLSSQPSKTTKYLYNFNYSYIEKLDLVSIILLKDYIYKIIKLKKPLQINKGNKREADNFINKLKKTIEIQIYFIKTNKDHPNYVNRYLNKDKIKDLLIDICYCYDVPISKLKLIEKHAKYIYKNKEKIKDYNTICNLSALYQNGVLPPLDISDYY